MSSGKVVCTFEQTNKVSCARPSTTDRTPLHRTAAAAAAKLCLGEVLAGPDLSGHQFLHSELMHCVP